MIILINWIFILASKVLLINVLTMFIRRHVTVWPNKYKQVVT